MDESLPVNVLNPFEDEVINIGTRTALKLLSLGSDELALYSFYCITAKRQSITLQRRVTTIKATEAYCLNGLKWGQLRFRTTKKRLIDEGLVKNIIKKDEKSGKVLGYYIQINYVPIETSRVKNQSVDDPAGGQLHGWNGDTPNTDTSNILNTVKDNLNTGGFSSVNTSFQAEILTKEILMHFNTVYKTKYTAYKPIVKLAEHWLEQYSIDEIKQAITNSRHDPWWKDKLTPTILLRKMNPNKEPVDYIGSFLNMSISSFDATPLTPLRLWEIAKEYDINLDDVNRKYKDVIFESERGSFPSKYKYNNVEQALRAWLEIGINKGTIKHCNDVEKMKLDNDHPDAVAFRESVWAEAKQYGVIE